VASGEAAPVSSPEAFDASCAPWPGEDAGAWPAGVAELTG
jgi:hypothetical protein